MSDLSNSLTLEVLSKWEPILLCWSECCYQMSRFCYSDIRGDGRSASRWKARNQAPPWTSPQMIWAISLDKNKLRLSKSWSASKLSQSWIKFWLRASLGPWLIRGSTMETLLVGWDSLLVWGARSEALTLLVVSIRHSKARANLLNWSIKQ